MAETDTFELPGDETQYLILEQIGYGTYRSTIFSDDSGDITNLETMQAFADNLAREDGASRPRVVKKTTTYELWEDGEPHLLCTECGKRIGVGECVYSEEATDHQRCEVCAEPITRAQLFSRVLPKLPT